MTRVQLSACVLLIALEWGPTLARAQSFTDVTKDSGLDAVRAVRANDWWVSGLHLVDLDGDGKLDVFLSSHGSYGALAALNDGSGHFSVVDEGYPSSEIHIPYDVDEDGLLDLATTYQDGGGQWWLNRSHAGSLDFMATDVTREGNTSRIQVMLDVNHDGKVDWIRASETEDGVIVDYGDGKGHFKQGSTQLPGLGNVNPIPVDLDGDGDKDWVTSWGDYRYEPGKTNIYREDGDLDLVDITTDSGLYSDKLAVQGVGDFDQDGDVDLIAIEDEKFPPTIFLNDGHAKFTKLAGAISGVPGNPNYPTWGLGVVTDLDNDGIADMLFDGRNYLHALHGTGGGKLTYVNEAWGIENTAEASVDNGFAFGDVDGDGDLDVLGWKETYPDRYFSLYRNDLPKQHWVRVRPVGLDGNRGAAGAKIRIYAAGSDQLLWYEDVEIYCRQVQPGYGYHFAETERHYGLGERTKVDVTVEFYPSHKLVRQDGVAADQTVRIGEDGEGMIVQPPASSSDAGMETSSTDAGSSAGSGGHAGSAASAGRGTQDAGAAGSGGMSGRGGASGASAGSAGKLAPTGGNRDESEQDAAAEPESSRDVTGGCSCGIARSNSGHFATGAWACVWIALALLQRRSLRRNRSGR